MIVRRCEMQHKNIHICFLLVGSELEYSISEWSGASRPVGRICLWNHRCICTTPFLLLCTSNLTVSNNTDEKEKTSITPDTHPKSPSGLMHLSKDYLIDSKHRRQNARVFTNRVLLAQ